MPLFFIDIDGTLVGRGGSLFRDSTGQPTTAGISAYARLLELPLQTILISSRPEAEMLTLSRLFSAAGYVADFGAVIRFGEERHLLGRADFRRQCEQDILPQLLREFDGYVEKHFPWYERLTFTVLLRGCRRLANRSYTAKALARWLSRKQLAISDNGATSRRDNLVCSDVRIFHLRPPEVSKAHAVAWLRQEKKLSQAFGIGDSPADLEFYPYCDVFFFAGSTAELAYAQELTGISARDNLIPLEVKGPAAFERAVEIVSSLLK